MEFSLGFSGLKRINYSAHDNDFTFKFNNVELECPLFIAELISNKVVKNLRKELTINHIDIDLDIENDRTLSRLRNLFLGGKENIENDDDELLNVLFAIGNEDIFDIYKSNFSTNNVLKILKYKDMNYLDYQEEIEFIASNFEVMKDKDIPDKYIPDILDSPRIKVDCEETILSFVSSKIATDRNNISLIKYIKCEYLDNEEFQVYLSLIDSISSYEVIGTLWPYIRKRFDPVPQTNQERHSGIKHIKYFNGKRFNGIIDYLGRQCKGNAINKGVIAANASSLYGDCSLESIAQDEGQYVSLNQPNSWIKLDFKDRRINVNAYSLKSNSKEWSSFIRSWKLEGSNDDANWEIIDNREECRQMNGALNEETFMCNASNKFYKFIKITSTGKSWADNNFYLLIRRIEFFGSLKN